MKLWLSGVDAREKVAGVKAIRQAGEMGGMESVTFASLSGAAEVWKKVAKGQHILIVMTDDPDVMRRVTKVLDGGGLRYQLTQDDEMPEPVEPQDPEEAPSKLSQTRKERREAWHGPDPEPKPYIPSVQATQGAAILLAITDSPGEALATARSISGLTGDDFWEDVAEYIIRTFPGPPQVMAALLAQR